MIARLVGDWCEELQREIDEGGKKPVKVSFGKKGQKPSEPISVKATHCIRSIYYLEDNAGGKDKLKPVGGPQNRKDIEKLPGGGWVIWE
jgi:hypothetical protein